MFEHSDGRRNVRQLAKLLRSELGAPADEAWVQLALDRLHQAHLLEGPPLAATGGLPLERRELLRRVGIGGAALLPVVISPLAPTPAQAANTCVVNNAGCSGKAFATPCHCGNPLDCGVNCHCNVSGACVSVTTGLACSGSC